MKLKSPYKKILDYLKYGPKEVRRDLTDLKDFSADFATKKQVRKFFLREMKKKIKRSWNDAKSNWKGGWK